MGESFQEIPQASAQAADDKLIIERKGDLALIPLPTPGDFDSHAAGTRTLPASATADIDPLRPRLVFEEDDQWNTNPITHNNYFQEGKLQFGFLAFASAKAGENLEAYRRGIREVKLYGLNTFNNFEEIHTLIARQGETVTTPALRMLIWICSGSIQSQNESYNLIASNTAPILGNGHDGARIGYISRIIDAAANRYEMVFDLPGITGYFHTPATDE